MGNLRDASSVAILLGAVFIAAAILGFVPNPLVGPHGLFVTNAAHNFLHGVGGIALIAAAVMGYGKKALLVFGIVYVLIAILGYATMMSGGMLLGLFMVNMADHYLHLALGLVLIAAGVFVREK